MPAYVAFLKKSGINTQDLTYELTPAIRPQLRRGSLVAPREDDGSLKGDEHFSIIGPVNVSPYDRWAAVEGYTFNVSNADESGRSDCSIAMLPSVITPKLVKHCAVGRPFAFVRLEIWLGSTANETRLAITMKDVTITKYRGYSGSVRDGQGICSDGNMETYNLKFKRCEWGHLTDANNLMDPSAWETG